MAPRKSTPPPIDRPLSKAFLRQFKGWSNEFPPGQSEPSSLRVMENVLVDRNGALSVRPGIRHLSYDQSPDIDPTLADSPGVASSHPPIGSMEPFYLGDGTSAMLYAVREDDGRVGFRALRMSESRRTVWELPELGFTGYDLSAIPFTKGTSYVEYAQIDNVIIALSDNGEPARHFTVGDTLSVSIPQEISVPAWVDTDKPTITHPSAAWIMWESPNLVRTNLLHDPRLILGTEVWTPGPLTEVEQKNGGGFIIRSLPSRTNLVNSPLHDVPAFGTEGWFPLGSNSIVEAHGSVLRCRAVGAGVVRVRSSKILDGIVPRSRYRLALDIGPFDVAPAIVYIEFLSISGAPVGVPPEFPFPAAPGRWELPSVRAPEGAVAARIGVAGMAVPGGSFTISNVVFCRDGESTDMFHVGSPGMSDVYWSGAANRSATIWHPPVEASLTSRRAQVVPGLPYGSAISAKGATQMRMALHVFSGKDGYLATTGPTVATLTSSFQAVANNALALGADRRFMRMQLNFPALGRGGTVELEKAILEQAASAGTWFDGSVRSGRSGLAHRWQGAPHRSGSLLLGYASDRPEFSAQAPTANTLISSDASKNVHKLAFLYTFENEVGESAPSMLAEIRTQRGWFQWKWQMPLSDGNPGTTQAPRPSLSADQLVVHIPAAVFDVAVQQGATRWNLYGMSWSDQDAVPVTLEKVHTQKLYPDPRVETDEHRNSSWVQVTPQRTIGLEYMPLPQEDMLQNSSHPLRHLAGVAEADRLIMVGNPRDPSTIVWSSSTPGRFTTFTPSAGGGEKTLSSGNLHLPIAAVLWQNPQSVDTLTVLCTSQTERSITYYMTPAVVQSQQGNTPVMGFEQTTNTPGSESPYAVEVLNNALYRPLDTSLLKSTASNYNISHRPMTDQIATAWTQLLNKYLIVSEQLDNRLYYLVHNSRGAPLQDGCSGNEIWVLDIAAEQGHWSRFLIQASSITTIRIGGTSYIAVLHPEGVSSLDPGYRADDRPGAGLSVLQLPIPWRVETNLLGANRAHDAWAHVRQSVLTLGSFEGHVKWGMKGYTTHGEHLDISKTSELKAPIRQVSTWNVDDPLIVRRDMKEWYFYAESVPGKFGTGSIQIVQFRYTPVSVNVGGEFGSVETFEYGSPVPGHTENGVPQPFSDAMRSWSGPSTEFGAGAGRGLGGPAWGAGPGS